MTAPRTAGRPRAFDTDAVIDRVVDTVWRLGPSGTTTRVLEAELDMSQSSIYNAFGSKAGVIELALDRYEEMLDRDLLGSMGQSDAKVADVLAFVDRLVAWVSTPGRRGCLLLNAVIEADEHDAPLVERGERYRGRILDALKTAMAADAGGRSEETDDRAVVALAATLGISAAARSGASDEELDVLASALRQHVADGTAGA